MIPDYTDLKKAEATPIASSMVETFRAIGYNLQTAIADIIDNSISANAKNIWITRLWRGGKSVVTIKDDGCGMDSDEIIKAMRPGSANPNDIRKKNDLGRFGLGLKTASFSQCRKLTVMSKKIGGQVSYWTWDIDFVAQTNSWNLIALKPDEYLDALDNIESGTMVIWENLDRVIPLKSAENDENVKKKFSTQFDIVKQHIAMTFHRFIERKQVQIFWGENQIEAWDPFCKIEQKIQTKPIEYFENGVVVQGYILPHKDSFSSEQAYKKAEGIKGWPAQQGFYIYRADRLLLSGGWLSIRRQEEHCKLVRICIDLPNSLDSDWKIDIKKSNAEIPGNIIDRLKSYTNDCCKTGNEVFRHRGHIVRKAGGENFQPIWCEKRKDNTIQFVINRKNSFLVECQELAKDKPQQAISMLLDVIEKSIPTKAIYCAESENNQSMLNQGGDFNIEALKQIAQNIIQRKQDEGFSKKQAITQIVMMEPFNFYKDIIEEL